jgi:hypothetical protein
MREEEEEVEFDGRRSDPRFTHGNSYLRGEYSLFVMLDCVYVFVGEKWYYNEIAL